VTLSRVASSAWLVDLVFPPRCVGCRCAADLLCAPCRAALRPLPPPLCNRCGAPTAWPVERCRECAGRRLAFASARAGTVYAGPARSIVGAWKERGLRRLAALAAEVVVDRVDQPAADVITYIPPDRVRQLGRSEHPARLLAEELSRRWDVPLAAVLGRRSATARQTGLAYADRGSNVRGAFVPVSGAIPGRVLLVDDVYTTGATASAASTALRAGGARRVEVVTFARAVR
jgi:predicted amidophosphoribosyltransferase